MNSLQSSPENPFTRTAFWGRQNELRTIYKYLLSEPPQSCAIVGETSIGKTTLLHYLSDPQATFILDNRDIKDRFMFVYLDCNLYFELVEMGDYASARFWWDLYSALWIKLQPGEQPTVSEPKLNANQPPIDTAFEIKCELEALIRRQQRPVIFVLDNFEGVARLPLRDSEWLRSMAQRYCTYVVSSRHLLYLLYQYHQESWATPSPVWNLFSDPIYLGLIPEQEVQVFLAQASQQAKELGSCWEQGDTDFIRKFSGRHPELIRIACARLFEQRLLSGQPLKADQDEFLKISISRAATSICDQLWRGLADPELWNVPGIVGTGRGKETWALSPYQEVLIRIAKGQDATEKNLLFVLEQRGLIEWRDGKWHVFAEVMRQFVLEQATVTDATGATPVWKMAEPGGEERQRSDVSPVQVVKQPASTIEQREGPSFAYLEGKVYDYLKAHVGEVCDREDIKRAVWENNLPTNSALQKIIERIREKIEPDPTSPRYLIAVRGQGFMLREKPPD